MDSNSTVIANDKVASVHYRGTFSDTGQEFDSSQGDTPLHFIVGAGQMIPGFEAALIGASVGDKRPSPLNPMRRTDPKTPKGFTKFPETNFPPSLK